MAKKRKRKGKVLPQRRGRALKSSETRGRYPSGKLHPEKIAPNAAVIVARQIMVDAPTATGPKLYDAENPLDLAKRRRWITPSQHQAGTMLAELVRKAGLDLPGMRVQDIEGSIRGHSAGLGN